MVAWTVVNSVEKTVASTAEWTAQRMAAWTVVYSVEK